MNQATYLPMVCAFFAAGGGKLGASAKYAPHAHGSSLQAVVPRALQTAKPGLSAHAAYAAHEGNAHGHGR
jgi:hypothetical protein